MRYVNCDLCGSRDASNLVAQRDIIHRSWPRAQEFYLQKCDSCGLIYLNPRPETEELKQYYPENYDFHREKNLLIAGLRRFLRDTAGRPYLNRLAALPFYISGGLRERFIGLLLPRKDDYLLRLKPCRVLDIGCGSGLDTHFWGAGSSLYSLRKKGFTAVGIESSARARRVSQKYGLKVYASISELESEQFDCVRMSWSLEHVDCPSLFFAACKKLMRPKAKLLVCVPNYSGILYRLFPDCVELPLHNYYFTPATIEAYLNKFGFNIIEKNSFSYPGMFVFAHKAMDKEGEFKLSPWEAIDFQTALNKFDAQMLGNDMVYFCENV